MQRSLCLCGHSFSWFGENIMPLQFLCINRTARDVLLHYDGAHFLLCQSFVVNAVLVHAHLLLNRRTLCQTSSHHIQLSAVITQSRLSWYNTLHCDDNGRMCHTMDLLWEKFQWILPLYMKPISFQSKASVVCPVTAVIFIRTRTRTNLFHLKNIEQCNTTSFI